jgi:ammonia channel protein AmtB
VWADGGWLKQLGVVDVAGDGPVHVVGGFSALVAAIMLKPRKGRFTSDDHYQMESPVGAILGLFILWYVLTSISTFYIRQFLY